MLKVARYECISGAPALSLTLAPPPGIESVTVEKGTKFAFGRNSIVAGAMSDHDPGTLGVSVGRGHVRASGWENRTRMSGENATERCLAPGVVATTLNTAERPDCAPLILRTTAVRRVWRIATAGPRRGAGARRTVAPKTPTASSTASAPIFALGRIRPSSVLSRGPYT